MSDVVLMIGDQEYSGWEEVQIKRSLDALAHTFDLTLTDHWPGQDVRRPIRGQELCVVYVKGEKVITGYIDKINPSYNAKSHTVTVSGRAKTADLVDCTLPGDLLNQSQRNNQTFLQLAQFVVKPFGLKVSTPLNGFKPIRRTNIDPGMTVFEFLESRSRSEAVMLLSDANGNLVIDRANNNRVATALVLGENIEHADGEFNYRDRFSDYYVVGQQSGDDYISGDDAAHVSGRTEDKGMRYRPTLDIIDDNNDIAQTQRYAEWMRNVNYGRSLQATYTVTGWEHADGLWEPNHLVYVQDEWMGFNGELMIGTVEFVLDRSGTRTHLTVMPKEAYDLIPLPDKADDEAEYGF